MEDATGTQDPADYQSDAYVYQLDRDGSTLRTYRFHDVFPTNISTIELNYDTTDTIQEFTVEMQVQWWEAIAGRWSKRRRSGHLLIHSQSSTGTPKGVLFLWSKYRCKTVYIQLFLLWESYLVFQLKTLISNAQDLSAPSPRITRMGLITMHRWFWWFLC